MAAVAKTLIFPFGRRQIALGLLVLIVTGCLLFAAPRLNEEFGAVGYEDAGSLFNYGETNVQWQENSFGQTLTPQSSWARLAIAPLRIVAYIVVPLRSFSQVAPPYYWLAYEVASQAAASVVFLLLFPLALVSLPLRSRALCQRHAWLVFPFWGFMVAVAVGTAELHARYRVMATPFLCACIWLGRSAGKRTLLKASILWGTTLVYAAALYVMHIASF